MNEIGLSTQFKLANDSPGFLLWQLSNKWQAKQRTALKQFDLTHVQFVLLATLTYAVGKNNFTQKQLAAYAQIDTMMTSQVIRKLEQKGLVRRKPSQLDGRAFTLVPTPLGVKVVNQAVKKVEEVDTTFFAAIRADLPSLLSIMQRLVK